MAMHELRGPPLEVVNNNLTRRKLDAKRTTASQPKKTRGRGGGSAVELIRDLMDEMSVGMCIVTDILVALLEDI